MTLESRLECLEIVTPDPANRSPVASVVVLHGLGADGSDFLPVARAMNLAGVGPVRFVLPSAPARPVTRNGGYVMRAWYDLYPPSEEPASPRQEDVEGLRQSRLMVQALLDREVERGIPSERTVLMGFSQGCAMALLTGLRAPRRLAGLVALSGYLPLAEATAAEAHPANRGIPVFMGHGDGDDIVDPARGRAARDALLDLDCRVDWHTYPMGHELCLDEVGDLNAWLQRVLAV